MAKKRKSKTSQPSTGVLVDQAKSHLSAGRYRDAIDSYKQLLKREDRPAWREALANAYMGRAEQLAAKAMYKEAAALWENKAALCGDQHQLDRYIDWLLRAGRFVRGARMFAETDEGFQQSPDGCRLAALLAGLLVSGHGEITESLPEDSPLLRQREDVLAAMKAYCQGDDDAVRERLKSIPFRSPYRDLGLILKALVALASESRSGVAQLDKIASDSPLARFAQLVRTAELEGDALLEALSRCNETEREWLLTLKGWEEQHIKQLGRLSDIQTSDPKTLFKFAIAAGEPFETASLKQFCFELLPAYPEGLAAFENRFGEVPLSERERIRALAEERRQHSEAAGVHWANCANRLMASKPSGDDALKTALILRHRADLSMRTRGADPWDEGVQRDLAKSLEFDPEDKETYLKLMEMAQRRDDRKAQDHWVERAVGQFPEDAEVLMAAGRAAYRRRAFKKAAGFAHTLLKRDPINPHARNLLISCHMAHARKQIRSRRHDLAERELITAAEFVREEDQRGIVELNRGFLALLNDQEQEGQELWRQGLQHLGNGIIGEFRFMVDGRRLGIAQRTLTQHYNRVKGKPLPPTVKDILMLAELLHRYVDDGVKEIPQLLDRLRAPLKTAAKLEFSAQELQTICVALQKAGHHLLLKDYAEAAMNRFGQEPRFLYYYMFGRSKGRSQKLTPLERIQLQGAVNRALDAGDHVTASRIEELIGFPSFGPAGLPPLPPDMAEGFEEVIDDLMDRLNTDNFEDVLDFIEERLREEGGLPPLPLPRGRRR